jgi:hypothetical protein
VVDEFRRNFFLIISWSWPSWRKLYPVHCYRLKVSFTPVLTMYLVFFKIPASSRYLEIFKQIIAGLGYLNHQNQRTSSHQKPNTLFCYI